MAIYRTNTEELTSIADAIRSVNDSSAALEYPNGFSSAIKQFPMLPLTAGLSTVATGPWIRPNDWPNLDSLTVGADEQVVYLTYDLRKTPGYGWLGLYIQLASDGDITLSLGHIENGEFISDGDTTFTTNNWSIYIRKTLSTTEGNVQLYRIIATKNITYFSFVPNDTGSSTTNFYNFQQPCVERKGRLDYSTISTGTPDTADSSKIHCTLWMEKDALIYGSKVKITSLANAWYYAINLYEINFDEWDTSLWEITSMIRTFYHCHNLLELDTTTWHTENWKITNSFSYVFGYCYSLKEIKGIEDWDTSQWTIPNMEETWLNCYSLESLDLNDWDTSNWTIEYLSNTWGNCYNLKELKIGNWDVSNWRGGTIASAWLGCMKLVELDISNWDVSNWSLRSLASTWNGCYSLTTLDISKWNTSNWVVNSLSATWAHCHSLRKLDIENWNTSKWAITNLSSTWTYCYNLKELKLNKWDTSNWAVTSLDSTWSYTYSLKTLEIDNWDVSNWAVTAFNSTWYYAYSLPSLNLSKWNVSNWRVTNFSYTWCCAYSLRELNLNTWDTSDWAVTSMGYTFQSCYSLISLDISHFDTSNWNVSSLSYLMTAAYNIVDVKLPSIIKCTANVTALNPIPVCLKLMNYTGFPVAVNQTYTECRCLTIESLLNILNALPTVTSTKTVTLGTYNRRKLTAAQIAIATAKGWTVA